MTNFRFLLVMLTLTAVVGGIDAASAQAVKEPPIWTQETLTGDWGGSRTALEKKGIEFGLNYIGETFSVPSGGLQRGTSFEGRFDAMINADLEKLFGWTGSKAHVRAFQIHNGGRNAADLVGSIADPSNIDALATTRLFTAWFQQDFGKSASVRIGQLAADDEFLVSNTAGGLINGTFGWATIMSANVPSGGPAYPLATPGVRLQVNPTEDFSILAAVFSGDPAGANCNNFPQVCNRYGTAFSFSGGAFWIGEAQYQVNQEKDAKGLAAAYKLGAWYHTGNFADQHFGIDPATGAILTLATTPTPDRLNRQGDWGMYGVIDQMLWRGDERSASVFVRGGFAPSDRNLVSWYVDGGVGFKGLVPGRADDTLTLGVAHSNISKDAAALDRDTFLLNGSPFPIRTAETVFELSYILQMTPWWTVQPDLQYIVYPGGKVPDPKNLGVPVQDAFVLGVRSSVKF
jgi:porin